MFNKNGAILFVTLWALVILSIFSLGITSRVGTEMRLAKYLKGRLVSLYLAKAALSQAILELEKDQTPDDSIYELQNERRVKFGSSEFSFKFIDEESLININTASQIILGQLPGLNEELAKKIIESGMRPFTFKEELLLIDGITKEIYLQFKDLITVYGSGAVNINTASREVLQISGLADNTIETILNFRKGEDGEELTSDDAAYAALPEGVAPGTFGTTSNYLRADISCYIVGKNTMNYQIVIEGSSRRVLVWQEA